MKNYLLTGGLLMAALVSMAQVRLDSGLVAHYPFDGDAQDISGNGNHGTVFGAQLSTDRLGNPDAAYEFDGRDDYIRYRSQQAFQPQLPVTVAVWVLLEDHHRNMVFANHWQENSYQGIFMGNNTATGKIIWAQYGDGGAVGPSSRRSKGGTTELQLGTWYHVAVIIRGPRDMDIFINGRNDCGIYSGSGGNLFYYSSLEGQTGISDPFAQNNPLDYFHGKIDDLRFWDRALSAEEVLALQDLPPEVVAQDVQVCRGTTLTLEAGQAASYRWSPATGLSCTDCRRPEVRVDTDRTYTVTVSNEAGCETTRELNLTQVPCDSSGQPLDSTDGPIFDPNLACEVGLPNIFTPNGDGANDHFQPQFDSDVQIPRWEVYDRWGRELYQGRGSSRWDGLSRGKPVPIGTYFVVLRYQCGAEQRVEKTTLTLLR